MNYPSKLVLVSESFDSTGKKINYDSEELMLNPKEQLESIRAAFSTIFSEVMVIPDAASFVAIASSLADCVVFSYGYGWGSDINRVAHVTAACEAFRLPYIGADTYTRVICRDKWLSKKFAAEFQLHTPPAVIVRNINEIEKAKRLKSPMIVKPNSQSCCRFIDEKSVIYNVEYAKQRVEDILSIGDSVLIEEFVDAQEISICYLGSKKTIKFREIVTRKPKRNKIKIDIEYVPLDHRVNQVHGYLSTDVFSTDLPSSILEKTDDLFRSLSKCNCLRIDGRFDGNSFHLIELTPDPGIAPEHSISLAAASAGYDYKGFLDLLIQSTLEDL